MTGMTSGDLCLKSVLRSRDKTAFAALLFMMTARGEAS
jgi:hypothetical protein